MPCIIGIGKPKKDAQIVKQKSIDVKDRIHWNTWENKIWRNKVCG